QGRDARHRRDVRGDRGGRVGGRRPAHGGAAAQRRGRPFEAQEGQLRPAPETTRATPRGGSRSGAPGGIRTPNLLIRSQMLYPLSYGRVAALASGLVEHSGWAAGTRNRRCVVRATRG